MKTVTGFASATIGNVACGFDVLGFAITEPGDEVILTQREKRTDLLPVSITSITGDGGALPRDPKKNTSSFVVLKFLEHIRTNKGIDFEGHIELQLKKNLPLSSGMGSSAASAAAALVAANELMGNPCSKMELVHFAIEGERVACGSAHADNAAPAMLGNFVLIRSYNPIDLITIPPPDNLFCTLAHPHIELRTAYARSVLPRTISLKAATEQWGNVGALISGLLTSDYELIGRSLVDAIAEPKRAPLIPGFYSVKNAALEAGALGCSIAGSGPSIFAFSSSYEAACEVGEAMKQAFSNIREKLQSDIWVSPVCKEGAKII
ncbi:homoserine kinase [Prosthecochloris sp. SCSIO W1101]|uniref:homoserine kinase n=1 Tax=Prosthecochloris sp. SCSIO W1101 TaxID=2992242 RepID=UPI00223E8BBB|nr:homoserine kinase [Prosthecochloris sp. SCSIO W1101]UZJ41227.1 homoserine kinase [Prosthecochloris sp. SCSIO W1101]